jgi:ParB family transcriptional regulator, chromosome partitioning protein
VAAPKKKGLGRGLGALIGGPEQTAAVAIPSSAPVAEPEVVTLSDGSRLVELNPQDVKPNPQQPRLHFNEEQIEELAASIKQDGLIEPIVVRQVDGIYELISGERRVRASIMAEQDSIPAIIKDVHDDDLLKLGLIENIQREDLNPIELAQAYKLLGDKFDWTQDEIAKQVGKKRATVSNTMRLLHLPTDIQEHVLSGSLSMGHARALLAIGSESKQRSLCRRILEDGLSVREVERAARPPLPRPEKRVSPANGDPHTDALEDELRKTLGTKVRVKADKNHRGKIEIDFYSLDDLDRILDMLRRR